MSDLRKLIKEHLLLEKRIAQLAKDKAIVEAMFSNNSRPLNNQYLLEKEEN